MIYWEILGIEKTTDKDAIRAAYLKKLPSVHPEEDPEGFRELREAYEAALNAPVAFAEEEDDNSPVGEVMRTFRAICSDFTQRIDTERWREALADERCADLATQEELGFRLLAHLRGESYIPQPVWVLLDNFFDWSEREEALRKNFPDTYIDYMLNSIKREENIRAIWFTEPDKTKYELLIKRVYELQEAVGKKDREAVLKIIETIDKMELPHPDYLAHKLAFLVDVDSEAAEATAQQMLEMYPDDGLVLFELGDYKEKKGLPEEAIPFLRRSVELLPEHFPSQAVLANVYEQAGRFEESKEICENLLLEYRYSSYVWEILARVSEALIPDYKKALSDLPGDAELCFKLAKCYYNAGRLNEAIEALTATKQEPEDVAEHSAFCFSLLFNLHDDVEPIKEDLIKFLRIWEGNETKRVRLCGLPQAYYDIGEAGIAEEKAERLLGEFPGDAQICYTLALIYRERGDISAAINIVEAGLAKKSDEAKLLHCLAEIYYGIGAYGDAVMVIRRALQYSPYFYDMRWLEMRIYYINEEHEALLRACQSAEAYDFNDADTVSYKLYAIFRLGGQAPEDIVPQLQQILKQQPDNEIALNTLALVYLQMRKYADSVECYNMLIKQSPRSSCYVDRGYAYGMWGRWKEEERDYEKAIELDQDNIFAHFRLGVAHYMKNKMIDALEHLRYARDLAPDWAETWIYIIKTYAEIGAFNKVIEEVDEAVSCFAGADAELLRRFYREKLDACVGNNRYEAGCALAEYALNPDDESDNADVCRRLGDCYFETGHDNEAAEWYERAFNADEHGWDIWHRYAYFCRFGLKDKQRAMEAYKKAIEFRPDFWADYIHLANLKLESGQKEAAEKLFITAQEMILEELKKNRYPCAYYFLAECYLGLGDIENAEKCAKKARVLAKKYAVCVTHNCYEGTFLLARIRKSQGRAAEARRYYEQTVAVSHDREYVEARADFFI